MKIGINLSLWTIRPTASEHSALLHKIQRWGYDGVEVPIKSVDSKDIRFLAGQCDELNLGRTAILSLNPATADPASSDPKLRDSAVNEIKAAIDKTKQLGADLLGGPLFQGLGRFSGQPPTRDECSWAVETLWRAADYAGRIGVRIALEPINRYRMYIANTLADGMKLVDEIGMDHVGLLADTHHGNMEENDTVGAWRQAARYISHVHISENNWGTPGSGQAIPLGIFQVLKDMSYDGWLTIEAFGRVPDYIPNLHLWRSLPPDEDEVAALGFQFIYQNVRGGPIP